MHPAPDGKTNRPPIASLACVNHECPSYGQIGQGNLREGRVRWTRKTYGPDQIHYLRCLSCQSEFSERKNTPLWNSKIGAGKAITIADPANPSLGFHDQRVQQLTSTGLQADERWGFAGSKREQFWQAEVIDPATRLVVAFATGVRNERLMEQVLQEAVSRLCYPQGIVLFTDGEPSYKRLFRPIFGHPYRPARKGSRGRFPNVRYRLNRRQAQAIVRKTRTPRPEESVLGGPRQGGRLVRVETQIAHGSSKRVVRELSRLGFEKPNTCTIERHNGTARTRSSNEAVLVRPWMDATSVRIQRIRP